MGLRTTSKTRRHSGRKTAGIIFDGMGKEDIINLGLEPQIYWDDWKDYRDGFRLNKDKTQIRSEFMPLADRFEIRRWNNKLKKLIERRMARKVKSMEKPTEKLYFEQSF